MEKAFGNGNRYCGHRYFQMGKIDKNSRLLTAVFWIAGKKE